MSTNVDLSVTSIIPPVDFTTSFGNTKIRPSHPGKSFVDPFISSKSTTIKVDVCVVIKQHKVNLMNSHLAYFGKHLFHPFS